ncbi:MAG: FtsX-like permease family protein [Gemmatimonas sp.]|nr:FtsX-like permease family protein [Gemmatimonas sp.]
MQMNQLWNDLRYGLRMLLKTPGASGTVLLALSLGIGLSALTFSLIDGAVLPTLPVEAGDRIMRISRSERVPMTVEDYAAWSARQRSFEEIGAAETATVTLAIEGSGSEPVSSASITPSVLSLLSVEPSLGRPFSEQDARPGAPAVVLVSHNVWQDRLGSDPSVLGRTVRVDGRPAEVIGVMPDGFGFPWDQGVWMPLDLDPLRGAAVDLTRSLETNSAVGRLREGVSPQVAAQELTALTQQLDVETHGAAGPESIVNVRRYTDLFSESGQSATLAGLMLGIAFLVLLVACANVTNVLLARAIERQREITVRLALGASRRRIIAQLLAEISLLAAIGAVGGVGLTLIGTRFVDAAVPPGMPYWIEFRVDLPVLGFVAIVAVLTALMAGLLPAIQASRSNVHELLKDSARGSSSFRAGRVMRRLVGVEIALSFVLLVLAGLFIRSAMNFRATDFAFAPEEVYTANIGLPQSTYDEEDLVRFTDELRETLSALPQVADAVLATAVPGVGGSAMVPVEVEGAPVLDEADATRTRSIAVTPGFFELFRTSLVTGRDFDARDGPGALRVAIVNEAFATSHFPEGALDRRIRYVGEEGEEEDWLTVVGVTPDLLAGGVEGEFPEAIYLPLAQNPQSGLLIIARPRADFASLPGPVRESVAALDSDVALFNILPHDEVISLANSSYTWMSLLFLVSGATALFLAAIGLYGVMAFWVVQRTREIGVRMALGGQKGDIVRLVLRQGMAQTSIGLIAGVVLALPTVQLIRFALFGVGPYDPIVFGSILGVLLGAAWLGCWLPARRATRMDPLEALVAE